MHLLKNSFAKTLSLSEIGLLLLIPLASLTSHTWLPVPPTMVLFLGAVICWAFLQLQSRHSREGGNPLAIGGLRVKPAMTTPHKIAIVVFTIFAFYIFVSQYFMGTNFRHYMGAVFAPLYLVLVLIFSQQASDDYLKNLGLKFIRYSLIVFCVEVVLRYGINFWMIHQGTNPEHSFYQFKFGGPMYSTSNAVATHLVALLFFIFWWGQTYKQSMKIEICVTLILIALALSRASIPAIAIGLFYYVFFKNADWKKSLKVLFSIGVVGVFALWMLRYFPDYSFQTKFVILEEALIFFRETASLTEILFGIGILESGNVMTFHAHNHFLLYLMETGVFGLLLLLTTLFVLVKVTNGKVMIILVPFFVHVMAESNTFLPYFYVIVALMITTILNHDSKKNSLLLD